MIELLVALAITGLISGGLTMTIFQLFSGNAQSSNQMNVIRQVQNAGYWISRDVQMAQSTAITGLTGFPIALTWTDYEAPNAAHQVVYTLVGDQIKREHYTNSVLVATTFIAQNIDPANTSCLTRGSGSFSLPDGSMGTEDAFTITDPVGGDFGTISIMTPGDVVKLTPLGGATVDGGFSEKTLNKNNSPMSWATPVAGSSIIVTATSNSFGIIGTWVSTSGGATATITIDTNGNAAFTDSSGLVLVVTASVSGFRPASETRTYEIVPRPS